MKMKFINKILAIVVASAAIAATPGFVSAMNRGQEFLGQKRPRSYSDDNNQNNQSLDKNIRSKGK